MLTVRAAQELVLRHARVLPAETVALEAGLLGRVLAEDVVSDLDSPPFDKALVDGYAVRSGDVGDRMVVAEITAGAQWPRPLSAGEAVRIMTGAPLPPGADAVVMQERVQSPEGGRIRPAEPIRPGQNIMPRGREMRRGETVLRRGQMLRPQELGLLATVGKTGVSVIRRPLVGVLSTGDELVEPDRVPVGAQIRNSNAVMLAGQIIRAGGVPHLLGICRDDAEHLRKHIHRGLQYDMLLLSGGVSAGKLDLVPKVLSELGVEAIFHKIAMKPGKPLFFGKTETCLVFGLPGNPVSSLVGFELFVRIALNVQRGSSDPMPRLATARLEAAWQHSGDRPTYHPCRLRLTPSGWFAQPLPWFGSPDLRTVCESDGFCVFDPGSRRYEAGEPVPILLPG